MNGRDRLRLVQRYVERQKAYLPTYTTEHPWNERHGTPSKSLCSDGRFGFDTPVLRPRQVSMKKAQQAGRRKSRARGSSPNLGSAPPSAPSGETRSKIQDPAPSKKDKARSKRKKASSQTDTDDEHTARLADRRERKRNKRAIVNPPQQQDDDTSVGASKRGRANGKRVKKPAALALLYGFSATNVTKNRLTLKPAPFLGVFSKGRASAKKVTATSKRSPKNMFFSESAFLNKPSEQVADQSNIDNDSEDGLTPSISEHPIPQVNRVTDRTKEDRGKLTKASAVKTSQLSTRTAAESEVWDIELQSKLPSSARGVSSEPGTKDSAPVVLDPRRAEWAASMNATGEHEGGRREDQTPSLSIRQSRSREHPMVCSSPLVMLDGHDELGIPHAVDVSSVHPSHSASQVGRRATDTRPLDLHLVASKYFTEPRPVAVQEFTPGDTQTSRWNDDINALGFQTLGQAVEDVALSVETNRQVASPVNSLISVPQPMGELHTRCDIDPLEFPSDVSPYDDRYARVDILDVPCEPLGETYHGYPECSVVQMQGDRTISAMEYHHPHQGTTCDWCQAWCPSADVANDNVEDVPMMDFEVPYDQLAREYEDDPGSWESVVEPCFFEARGEYDPGEGYHSPQWFCAAETGQGFPAYEDEVVDGSTCYSGESLRDEERPGFSEGRALLLGVSEGLRSVGLSGLTQAEMDVARRLRDHWRPLRP